MLVSLWLIGRWGVLVRCAVRYVLGGRCVCVCVSCCWPLGLRLIFNSASGGRVVSRKSRDGSLVVYN